MDAPHRHRPQRIAEPNGFTLVEIATVIVIIGLLVGFAIPRLPIAGMRSDAAIRVLRGELQAAQRAAITRQSNVVVGVDIALNRLRIVEDSNNDEVANNGERVRVRPLEETVRFRVPAMGGVEGGAPSQPYRGSNLRERDGLPSIVFRRDGSASSDLELYVSSSATEMNSWRGVVVAPSTGRADAWRRTTADWRRMRP